MIIDIVYTFSATTIEAEAKSVSLVLTFPVTQAPSNICDEVKTCLGISSSGSNTKYLNEKGNWATPAGGGGGSVVIEVTKAEFLALVTANDLTYPTTYKITDIDNGLFIDALSENTFDTDGTLFSLQPSYIVSGVYKGQLLPTDSVSIGDIWVYGNHFWESVTGVNSTPIDFLNLDLTDWIKVPKSEDNGYINIQFIAQVGIYNGDLYITKLQNSATRDEIDVSSYFASLLADELIKSWVVIGENSEFSSFSNNGSIVNNRFNDVLFAYNTTPNNFSNMPFIYNVDGSLGELAGNINYSNSSIHDGVFNGADCLIARNSMTNSEIKNFNLAGNGVIRISSLNNSIIDNVVITQLSGKLGLSDLYLYESTISNVTDINIEQSSFHDIDIDFTGFDVDVYGVNIINGKGWFVVTHNFTANPLNSGSAVLYNIIPIGARITNLVVSGSANGNSIQIGLSGDDESLLILPTSLLNNQLITVSNAATANRSLLIKALTDPMTIGEITVKCEFVL